MIERLRDELNTLIDELGTNHPKVLEKSQELDRALNEGGILSESKRL